MKQNQKLFCLPHGGTKKKLDRVNETFEIDQISDVTPTIHRNKRDEEIVQWLESHSKFGLLLMVIHSN
jgi:hypothetical protein